MHTACKVDAPSEMRDSRHSAGQHSQQLT